MAFRKTIEIFCEDLEAGRFITLSDRIIQGLAETMNNMPPEFREYATRSTTPGMRIGSAIVNFIFLLFLGAAFSTIGGVLGALIFGRKTPPGVIDIPPQG